MLTGTLNHSQNESKGILAKKFLERSAACWLTVTLLGQWLFAFFIFGFYGSTAIDGQTEVWSKILPTGIAKGDTSGNVSLVIHLIFAAILNIGGPLQLVPKFRKSYPIFHRWNGRVFVVASILTAIAGLYMQWTRGSMGGMVMTLGNSSAALLIFAFSFLTWKNAISNNFNSHADWALRLFMVVSATWFFRIGLLFWFTVTGGIGIENETLTGPFITFWAFGQYMLPLIILESYLYTRKRKKVIIKWFSASAIFIGAIITIIGAAVLAAMVWIPFLVEYLL